MLQESAACLGCRSSGSWRVMKAFGNVFLDLSKDAHGSIYLPDGGSPGGVFGGEVELSDEMELCLEIYQILEVLDLRLLLLGR